MQTVENRKRFKAVIENVSQTGDITIKMEDTIYTIAYDNISKAKIILTDELWEQCLKSHKKKAN